jgi:hypothetical protein
MDIMYELYWFIIGFLSGIVFMLSLIKRMKLKNNKIVKMVNNLRRLKK